MNLPAGEGESDHEISEILSDLDKILTDITAAGPAASDKLRAARDAAAAKAALEEAATAKAAAEQAAVEKAAAEQAAVAEEIREAEELAKIAAAKAAAAQQLAQEAAEKAAAQKAAAGKSAAVKAAAVKAAAEKAAVEKAAKEKAVAEQAAAEKAAAEKAAEKAAPKPAAEDEKTVVLKPDEVKEIKKAAPPAAKPLSMNFQEKPIPEKTPKEQVRRVAYLCSAQQAARFAKCEQFIFQVAQKVSKKPIHVHTAVVIQIAAGMDSQQIVATVKKSGAAGALALIEGLGDAQTRDIEETFDNEDVFYRVIPSADVGKRTMAIDLVVDMMLLKAG